MSVDGRAVVTGGGGFLGGAIVRALLDDNIQVTSVSRGNYPELEALGVACHQADLADPGAPLADWFEGADTVYHCAAKAGVWGDLAAFRRANVEATQQVIAACLAAGVARLVFTSSPSVCFDGRDQRMASNDLPYAADFLSPYPQTKAEAERLALASHGRTGAGGPLSVCALRPHLIYGPGDPHLIPRVLEKARAGKLRIVGRGDNEVSLTHVQNAAAAHLAAAARLSPDAACGGQAYFIADPSPVQLWTWIDQLLGQHGLPKVTRRIPRALATAAGTLLESIWRIQKRPGEPPMTRFVAAQLSTDHSYDLGPAQRDLGYNPRPPRDLPGDYPS